MTLSTAQKKKLAQIKDPLFAFKKEITQAAFEKFASNIETIKGEKGETPTKEELIKLLREVFPTQEELVFIIRALIPPPEKGEKGDKGERGEKGPQGLKSTVPGPRGPKGEDAKLDADEIRDLLENLPDGKKLSIQAIEYLPEILEELTKFKNGFAVGSDNNGNGGGGIVGQMPIFIDDETPVGTIDGLNTEFSCRRLPLPGSLKVYRGGARQRVDEDYTLSEHGKKITFINAPVPGEIILLDYRIIS